MTGMATIALLASGGGEGGAVEQLLKAQPGIWLWTIGIFLLLLLILWRFGWGMMIDALDRRDKAIRGAVEQAKQERLDAERLLAEAKEQLARARRDAADAIAQAQGEAQREKQKIVDSAREEYDKIVARGREQIQSETKAALAQVRGVVANLALDVAGKLLQRSIDSPAQRSLAEQFVAEVEASKRQPNA